MVHYQFGSNGRNTEVAIIATMNHEDAQKRLEMIRAVFDVDLTEDVEMFRKHYYS